MFEIYNKIGIQESCLILLTTSPASSNPLSASRINFLRSSEDETIIQVMQSFQIFALFLKYIFLLYKMAVSN